MPAYPVEVWVKPVDAVSALATLPFTATRSPLAESVPPVLPGLKWIFGFGQAGLG